jgi:TPR repeat protein
MSATRIPLALLLLAFGFPLHAQEAASPATTATTAKSAAVSTDAADDDEGDSTPVAPKEDPSNATYWEAMKLFRSQKSEDLAHGRDLLAQAADAENSQAENYLGLALQHGLNGFTRDARKAVTWYTLAAQRGNAFAKISLGLCYLNGTGVRKDRAKARQWLEAALAEDADFASPKPPADFFADSSTGAVTNADMTLSGDLPVEPADRYRAAAHAGLGDLCALEKQTAKAQEHYVKAGTMGEGGRAGIYQAAITAAFNYAFGLGIPRDLTKANEMLEQSKKLSRQQVVSYAHGLVEGKALDDFAQADFEEEVSSKNDEVYQQIQLGIAGSFADPKSKNYNPQEAVRWFEVAAESGQAWAMLSLADLYQGKTLGAPDPAKAFKWFRDAAEHGNHMLGWANLAICYQNGFGTKKNAAKAMDIFKKYHEDSFVCYLGTINQCPAAVLTYEEELALTKTWARKHKDAHACYLYGLRFLHGWGVKADLGNAELWVRKATKYNYGPAWRELGNMYVEYGQWMSGKKNWLEIRKAAYDCFEKAAAANDAEGTINLADMYSPPTNGLFYSFPSVDEYRAESLYLRALELNPENGRAHNNLGVIYAGRFQKATRNHLISESADFRDKMIKHYEAAHQAKLSVAAWNLGNIYYDGLAGEKDYQAAYTYFEMAASEGYMEARRRLGEMHEKGEGVPVTYREAAYHYRLAALQGDMTSLSRLCDFYLQGKGVSQDLERASMWLLMLAERGQVDALVTLGDILVKREQYKDALRVFTDLTKYRSTYVQGSAYDRLSRLYSDGKGVKTNPAKAKRYHDKAVALNDREAIYADAKLLVESQKYDVAIPLLQKSANAGSSNASYELSALYFNGLGVQKNISLAMNYCRKAADKGNADAQFSLAVRTLDGAAEAPDLESAIRYAERAENSGHANAGDVRKKLEEKRGNSGGGPVANEAARSL